MYLVINEGDIYTHSLDVLLQLYAPPGTTVYFKVSNDSTFSFPPPNTTDWIPYSGAPYKWTLFGEGDSIKTVYGKFKNYQGQESLTISDWIIYKP